MAGLIAGRSRKAWETKGRVLEHEEVVAAIRVRNREGGKARRANGGGRLREGDGYDMT